MPREMTVPVRCGIGSWLQSTLTMWSLERRTASFSRSGSMVTTASLWKLQRQLLILSTGMLKTQFSPPS
nr:MAG: hypothetical protein [Molluscum contagiosum virus]